MNQKAYDAIKGAWDVTFLVRSIFPSTPYPEVNFSEIGSPSYFRANGTGGHVFFDNSVTGKMLNLTGKFVNESFVIYMMAILEEFDIVPYQSHPDINRDGGEFVQLTQWYRNRFAHGESEYDKNNPKHVETRNLFEKLFPELAKTTLGFPTSIDTVLPKLRNGVLEYIKAST